MDEKPEITKREVSWYAVQAAIRARREADARGIAPEARAALALSAAAEEGPAAGQLIRGTGLPLITLGTLWAMESTEPLVPVLCGGSRWADQALVCHTLLHPEEVLLSVLTGEPDAVAAGMVATAAVLTPDGAAALDAWFGQEMRRLRTLAGGQREEEVKK